MSIPKLCLRLAVFLCTLTVSLFVTHPFLIPARVEVRAVADAPPTAVVAVSEPAKVNFKVQQVVLDRAHKKIYAQLTVERDPHATAPEHLWVAARLDTPPNASPDKDQHWYFPFKDVPQPFAQGDRAMLTVVFPYPSGTDPAEFGNNLYAQVGVSPLMKYDDGETSLHAAAYYNLDISPAVPVVVEHGLKHSDKESRR